MDRIRYSTLDGLRKDFLDLLGNDGSLAIILSVCLGSGLGSVAACGMDLRMLLVLLLQGS